MDMDKEKLIKELRDVRRYLEDKEWSDRGASPHIDAINDALDLLKKQEAKAGTWQWKIHGKAESGGTLGEAVCDQCGKSTYATAVKGDLNYCPNCGAKMED